MTNSKFINLLQTVAILFVCLSLVEGKGARFGLNSRANQYFGVNCLMNRYLQHEYELGFEYLNASIYMGQDTTALSGFQKMFKTFWKKQIDNVEKISSFIVKRGGVIDTPGYKHSNNLNSFDYFANETLIVRKFLELEKKANKILLELHKATRFNYTEVNCVNKYNLRHRGFYSLPGDIDPYSASFLDSTFIVPKVERIKYLADLFRKVIRFDQHPRNVEGVSHNINQLGIHILDKELEQKFSI